jgi:L-iditol 2-dehydrogenase
VKVMHSGICGSDVMEWYRIKKAPRVLGHEIAGIIEKVGENVKIYKPGDRVFVSHHVSCDDCYYCKKGAHTDCHILHTTNFDPGGFAEYIRVPELQVRVGTFLIPDDMPLENGVFFEPLACVVRALKKVGIKSGETVLVLGSGISGIMNINLAKAFGAGKIIATDINDFRLQSAQKFGADHVLHASENLPSKIRELNNGYLADVVIVCAASLKVHEQSLECVEAGGRILLFAVATPGEKWELPVFDFYYKGITMVASYAGAPNDIKLASKLIQEKKVNVQDMISHRLPLDDIQKGFDLVAKAQDSLKVIIEPHG